MNYVKRAEVEAEPEDRRIRESVENMIADIRVNGETAVRSYACLLYTSPSPRD